MLQILGVGAAGGAGWGEWINCHVSGACILLHGMQQ